MAEDWPPTGYSSPKEYNRNNRLVTLLLIVLLLLFGVLTGSTLLEALLIYKNIVANLADRIGVSSRFLVNVAGAMTVGFGTIVLFKGVVVPFHESIHYGVALLFDLNPEFGYTDGMYFTNPRVAPLAINIPVWQNIIFLLAPFAVISLLSVVAIQMFSGILAGAGAIVLWMNSASSASDLYHSIRMFGMNRRTKFANFDDKDGIRTEYAVPL